MIVLLLFIAMGIVVVLGLYISWLSNELDKYEDLSERLIDENNALIEELYNLKIK